MDSRALIEIALRVLTQCSQGLHAASEDIAILMQNATPVESALPLDALACEIIKREVTKLGTRKSTPGSAKA